LVVNHRLGSLDAAVASFRRRNLAVSFGILLLLAASMAMVVVSTGRARKLAHLQMEFVAGVSHELRTPLAVICSAADNLAAGVVEAREQVREYGTLIGTQGLRLSHMVQQILLFASGQARRARYELRPVRIEEIIDRALAEARSTQGTAEVSIEKSVEPNLPPVMGDANALTHCLENLIGNAIKYGGNSRWISIRVQATRGPRGPELQVTIADRGIGIDQTELEHIFEPFYRGRAATATRCHGIGLGLSLAKEVAEVMGGRITVTSTVGKGSSFSLYLPAASESSGSLEMPAA
jgi:signal transduction histidine kinase